MSLRRQTAHVIEHRPIFETTKRLLAQAINDGLVAAFIKTLSFSSSTERCLCVQPPVSSATGDDIWITCTLSVDAYVEVEADRVVGSLRPDYLYPPLVVIDKATGCSVEELDPGPICHLIAEWQSGMPVRDNESLMVLLRELKDSVNNQRKWLEFSSNTYSPLGLTSPLIKWGSSIIWGHPVHPLHRTYLPLPPLDPILPNDLSTILEPAITFLSVPRHDLTISGPFEALLQPLLRTLYINNEPALQGDHVVVPCLTTQLPAILSAYPATTPLKTIHRHANAHISLRTVSLIPECNFPFHLKFSLNCQITSAIRNLHPHTVLGGPQISSLLSDLLPENLWVFEHAACVTGALSPPPLHTVEKAQYLSCILRRSLEERADAHGETLIPAAALYNRPLSSFPATISTTGKERTKTYAETLFNLGTLCKKKSWLRTYTRTLFSLLFPPLVKYGIGLEAHGQNVLLRVDKASGAVTGFAIRDFDGLRIHRATLRKSVGDKKYKYNLQGLVGEKKAGDASRNFVDGKEQVWDKVHHALIQLHVSHLVYGLGLEGPSVGGGGWAIVREELTRALLHSDGGDEWGAGREVCEYFLREKMAVKCFLSMRFKRISGDHFDGKLPNILLRD